MYYILPNKSSKLKKTPNKVSIKSSKEGATFLLSGGSMTDNPKLKPLCTDRKLKSPEFQECKHAVSSSDTQK
jgi:hypothetical protein